MHECKEATAAILPLSTEEVSSIKLWRFAKEAKGGVI
jgi:hypothetical protein